MTERRDVLKVDNGSSGVRIMEVDFPSNAHNKREKKPEPKKLTKIVKGNVKKRKQTLGKKILNTFVAEDINNVFMYVVQDVLIPAAKNTLAEMIHGSTEMMIHGENRRAKYNPSQRRTGDRPSYINYGGYVNGRQSERRNISSRSRASHNLYDICLDSRKEADDVIFTLAEYIDQYGQATVANLYELVGIDANHTDERYGWDSLGGANSVRVKDGYLLNLPKPILLD